MFAPTNQKLYDLVKSLANDKFDTRSGVYRSSWIVNEYKRLGGRFKGSKPRNSGLKRWYKEKWVDLNRPIRDSKGRVVGYEPCGRSSVNGRQQYPLCRPSSRVSPKTPQTHQELSKDSIRKAKKQKSKVKGSKNIKFGGSHTTSASFEKYDSEVCIGQGESWTCKNSGRTRVCDDEKCTENQYGSGKKRSQFYGKKSDVMVKVPENVKKWALYAFKLKKLGFEGALETGWKRAKQLATKDSIPIQDLRYMRNWYARHVYTSYPGFKKWIEAGRPKDKSWHKKHAIQSWVTWGANSGYKWVNSKQTINLLNKYFDKDYKPMTRKL
jgi:hypothetical protein